MDYQNVSGRNPERYSEGIHERTSSKIPERSVLEFLKQCSEDGKSFGEICDSTV